MIQRRQRGRVAGLVVTAALVAGPCVAHVAPSEQVVAISKRIEADPENVELLLRRADLQLELEHFHAAFADYDRVEKLDPDLVSVHFLRGRAQLQAGQVDAALASLDRFLTARPGHALARLERARALARNGENLAAGVCCDSALAQLDARPQPQYYLDCGRYFAAAGSAHVERAIAVLERGLGRLGRVVALDTEALEYEIRLQRWPAALARIERIATPLRRKEKWLARRGEVLELAGRPGEALAAYRAALDEIGKLPDTRRATPATRRLEQGIEQAVERLLPESAGSEPESAGSEPAASE